jgi:hypothetical protein
MAEMTLAQIEKMTRHLRAVVETTKKQEDFDILFEDVTDGGDNQVPPFIIVTFNAEAFRRRLEARRLAGPIVAGTPPDDDEIPF